MSRSAPNLGEEVLNGPNYFKTDHFSEVWELLPVKHDQKKKKKKKKRRKTEGRATEKETLSIPVKYKPYPDSPENFNKVIKTTKNNKFSYAWAPLLPDFHRNEK